MLLCVVLLERVEGVSTFGSQAVSQLNTEDSIAANTVPRCACEQVWPGPVHFPDFINPEGQKWWLDHVRDFFEKVPFDGLWVDMNEASNFCTGHVCELPPEGILDFVDASACPLDD